MTSAYVGNSGYSSLGSELTKGAVDQREQFDFGTPYECKWRPGDPEYLKLWGPPQVNPRTSQSDKHSNNCSGPPMRIYQDFEIH